MSLSGFFTELSLAVLTCYFSEILGPIDQAGPNPCGLFELLDWSHGSDLGLFDLRLERLGFEFFNALNDLF